MLLISPHLAKLVVVGCQVARCNQLGTSGGVDVRAELVLHLDGHLGDLG